MFYVFAEEFADYLPKGIGDQLMKLHPEPKAFWFGQFIKYILRHSSVESIIRKATQIFELPDIYVRYTKTVFLRIFIFSTFKQKICKMFKYIYFEDYMLFQI